MPDNASISVSLDFSKALSIDAPKAAQQLDKLFNRGINARGLTEPLGRITSQTNQFSQSLEAANARLLAFSLSAAPLLIIEKGLSKLVTATVEVDKALTDISAISGTTGRDLKKLGDDIFSTANKTSQSFADTAKTVLEFSRQGLKAEESLERTKNALILTRLATIDTNDAVETITAGINSFSKELLSSSDIVNRFAALDVKFAVSANDLAQAIKRVGSTAQDAGVEFNQLLAIVTAVQQTTARGGANIGEALKTIFTRLSRSSTIEQLQALGVQIDATQSGVQKLQALSNAVQNADKVTGNQIKELAGGTYRINIVSAALGDLTNKYGIYAQALNTARSAQDDAAQRNDKLNESLSSLGTRTLNNITNLFSKIGTLSIEGPLKNLGEGLNKALEFSIDTSKSDNAGEKFAQGFLKGFGDYIQSGGLILAGSLAITLGSKLLSFAQESLSALKLKSAAESESLRNQQAILNILQNNQGIQKAIQSGEISIKEAVALTVAELNSELALREKILFLAKETAATLTSGAGLSFSRTTGEIVRKAGKIPNFADPLREAINRESDSGIPSSFIKVGQDIRLKSSDNPVGLGVYNLIDEPFGLGQGVNRALKEGRNAKTYGAGQGRYNVIPNFINDGPFGLQRTIGFQPQKQAELNLAFESLIKSITAGTTTQQAANLRLKELTEKYQIAKSGIQKAQLSITEAISQFETNTKSVGAQKFAAQQSLDASQRLRLAQTPREGGSLTQSLAIIGATKAADANEILAQVNKNAEDQAAQSKKNLLQSLANAPKIKVDAPYEDRPIILKPKEIALPRIKVNDPFAEPLAQAQQRRVNESFEREMASLPTRKSGLDLITEAIKNKDKIRVDLPAGYRIPNGIPQNLTNPNTGEINRLAANIGSLENIFKFDKTIEELKKLNADDSLISKLKTDRTQSTQNRAFIASFLAPTLIGGIANTIPNNSTTGRGTQAALEGVGNASSVGLTLAAIGVSGGTAALAGAGSLLLSIPKIFDAFTNKIPDLTTKLEELQGVIGKNSQSIAGYIDASEKLNQIRTGEITGATKAQQRELERQQNIDLSRINNGTDRAKLKGFIDKGNFDAARLESGNISLRENQRITSLDTQIKIEQAARKTGFGGTFTSLSQDIGKVGFNERTFGPIVSRFTDLVEELKATNSKSEKIGTPLLDNKLVEFYSQLGSITASLGKFGLRSISPLGAADFGAQNLEQKLTDRKGAKTISSLFENEIFGKTNNSGQAFIEALSQNKEALDKLSQSQNLTQIVSVLKNVASAGNFDIGDLTKKLAEISAGGNAGFNTGLLEYLKKDLSKTSINTRITNPELAEQNAKDAAQSLRKVNDSIFETDRLFNSFAQSLSLFNEKARFSTELTNKLAEAQADFSSKSALIKEGGNNEFLSNFNQFGLTNLQNKGNFNLQNQELGAKFQSDILDSFNKLRKDSVGKFAPLAADNVPNAGNDANKQQNLFKSIGKFNDLLGVLSGLDSFQNLDIKRFDAGSIKNFQSNIEDFINNVQVEGSDASKQLKSLGLKPQQQEQFILSLKSFADEVDNISQKLQTSRELLKTSLDSLTVEAKTQFQNNNKLLSQEGQQRQFFIEQTSKFATRLQDINSGNEISKNLRENNFNLGSFAAGGSERINLELQKNRANLSGDLSSQLKSIPLQALQGNKTALALGITTQDQLDAQIKLNEAIVRQAGLESKEGSQAQGRLDSLKETQLQISKETETANKNYSTQSTILQQNTDLLKKQLDLSRQFSDFRAQEQLSNVTRNIQKFGTFSNPNGENQSTFGSLVKSQLDYGPKDFYKEVAEGTVESIQEIKKGFGSFLGEAIKSGKDAGQAFRDTFINILGNIVDKTSQVGVNSLVGGLSSLAGSLFKSNGGMIRGFSTGGTVEGGSGIKDDVPALLTKGEYVVKKSAVDALGKDFLDSINYGDKPSSIEEVNKGISLALQNSFSYDSATRPTVGKFTTDARLSSFALTDTDISRTNQIKFQREEDFYSYLKGKADYDKQKADALAAFKSQKRNRLYTSLISAAVGVAGAGISAYAGSLRGANSSGFSNYTSPSTGNTLSYNGYSASVGYNKIGIGGGVITTNSLGNSNYLGGLGVHYANGGRVFQSSGTDTVPALLTAGEYVIKQDVVNRHGLRFFEEINKGKVPSSIKTKRFASGGLVGDNAISTPINQSNFGSNVDLTSILKDLSSSIQGLSSKLDGQSDNSGGGNSFVFNITMNDNSVKSSSSQSDNKNKSNNDGLAQFGRQIQAIVTQEIIKEKKQGGLLSSVK